MRQNNKSIVIEELLKNKVISRAKLCKETNLNKATMTELIKELIDQNLVIETGMGFSNTQGGRKPVLLELNKNRGIIIAIEIDFNKILFSIHLLNGEIVLFESKKQMVDKDTIIQEILKIIEVVKTQTEFRDHEIIGMCIAVHGIVKNNKLEFSPKYNLDQVDIVAELKKTYSFPILIENEANAAAIAESTFKNETENLVNLNINSGIGAGIFMNNKLLKGSNGFAGEIGHSIYQPDGLKCICGNQGCVELYASTKALEDKILTVQNKTELDYSTIHDEFKNNSKVNEIITEGARILSIVANNIIVLLSPDLLILNGTLLRSIPEMLDMVKANIKYQYLNNTTIISSGLGERSVLYGCCAIVIKKFLNIKKAHLYISEKI
ncbi:ROK family protein [Spiroplasma clarkii]|nr:ROK family protein [Spiroplasma clarkii]